MIKDIIIYNRKQLASVILNHHMIDHLIEIRTFFREARKWLVALTVVLALAAFVAKIFSGSLFITCLSGLTGLYVLWQQFRISRDCYEAAHAHKGDRTADLSAAAF